MTFQKALRLFNLALIGGVLYLTIELLWRGYTHWTMGVVGGICFILIGLNANIFSINAPLLTQALIGTLFVTFIELISGLILNIWLKLGIWDYSSLPLNFLGQICLPYILLWFPLTFFAIILFNWLRYWLYNEDRPRFKLI
ncbi:hypothetical protein IEO70_11205 [Bacillus sp. AGMB 02131]|uniref:Uncharacterized protein n=1 Tax=Peribacillus faecalis TaxID=2772559 RepID=A0A927D0S3_9BACI|nr:hypothetical protein [Peribacillus faecalis]MBD3108929.1 hypothetical protein [Peribacillus faecalis]